MKNLMMMALVLAPTTAFAHASLETKTAPANSAYEAAIRIGHGCDGQPTLEVRVELPDGFTDAAPVAKDGWEASLAETASGVREIVWQGGSLPADAKETFAITGRLGDLPAGSALAFPTRQVCADAQIAWVERAAPGVDPHSLDRPAPVLTIADTGAVVGAAHAGDLAIERAWVRGVPPGAPVAGGYLTIVNSGTAPDRLLGGSTDFAGAVEVHEMAMTNGMMTMAPLPEGLPLPPGETVTLSPGGYHLMFLELSAPPKPGDTVTVTLDFAEAGPVEVTMPVSQFGAGAFPGGDGAGGHGHGEGDAHGTSHGSSH
ncbi:copper chaperone PCu(A)C [Acuticoccus kandeliae]|uniref:copper chaperone PCu(A)C n=1 Tax=Acuticoccus kandeliae TaxID=2073160 RepID=UPI000D3E7C56|nr:copper chaperone PCu(A)C [Acuticoccus kandeliae]